MKIKGLDHIVLTTESPEKCADFYGRVLGLELHDEGGRLSFHFSGQKINIHRRPAEFLPAAGYPLAGSLDLCFEAEGDISDALSMLRAKGISPELGPVTRHGARGEMQSLYLRDPDGNLVELGFYNG